MISSLDVLKGDIPMVKRIAKGRYAIDGIEDEEMSGPALLRFLTSVYFIPEGEVMCMIFNFNMHPHHDRAYFGMNGLFLYTTNR